MGLHFRNIPVNSLNINGRPSLKGQGVSVLEHLLPQSAARWTIRNNERDMSTRVGFDSTRRSPATLVAWLHVILRVRMEGIGASNDVTPHAPEHTP